MKKRVMFILSLTISTLAYSLTETKAASIAGLTSSVNSSVTSQPYPAGASSTVSKGKTLSGDYQGYLYNKYYIEKYNTGKYELIDSVQLDAKGTFIKTLDPKLYTPNTLYVVVSEGEYKGKKNTNTSRLFIGVRFVYMGEDISYKTSWRSEPNYLEFLKGGEASNHLKELNTILESTQIKLNSIEQLMRLLEEKDPLYKHLMEGYIQKAEDFNAFCQSIASLYPKGSYMNVCAQMYQQVVPQKGTNLQSFNTYRAETIFQFTDLKNPLVANVPILSTMYRTYLYHDQFEGFTTTANEAIEKKRDAAKNYIKNMAAPEVWKALEIQDFRPQIQILRERFVNELSFDTLYKDNKSWFSQINDILAAYIVSSPYHSMFGKDVITALERTKIPDAYSKLAEAALLITEQFGWNEAQGEVLDYLTERSDERLQKGSPVVAKITALRNTQVGKQAPDLTIEESKGISKSIKVKEMLQKQDKMALLLFYQSDCGHCEVLMQDLQKRYITLQEKGVRIIALASDMDEKMFKEKSASFPWKNTYCDYKGAQGINFRNYAVAGTPTIILVDKEGKILQKGASLEEMDRYFKE